MQLNPVWFAVEQLRRILASIGWEITAQDTGGPNVVVTIQKPTKAMQLNHVWFAVEQLRRILASIGWEITAQDTGGPNVVVTIQKPKEKILAP
jgi:hypothetical protein